MFESIVRSRAGVAPRKLAAIAVLAAGAVAAEAAVLRVALVKPIAAAVAALESERRAVLLVRVPEYTEEIEVHAPPGWTGPVTAAARPVPWRVEPTATEETRGPATSVAWCTGAEP